MDPYVQCHNTDIPKRDKFALLFMAVLLMVMTYAADRDLYIFLLDAS